MLYIIVGVPTLSMRSKAESIEAEDQTTVIAESKKSTESTLEPSLKTVSDSKTTMSKPEKTTEPALEPDSKMVSINDLKTTIVRTTNVTTTTIAKSTAKPKTTKVQTTAKPKTTKASVVNSSSGAIYSSSYFNKMGVIKNWGGWKWTWYSQRVLPGPGLNIPGKHLDEHGYVCDKDDNICLASSKLPKGTIVNTPFGKMGKVYDSGCPKDTLDVYTDWMPVG